VLEGQAREVGTNDLIFVHAGVEHNFINTGERPLKLYTVYAPPEHAEGTRHATKEEADAAEEY
jgi:mannose-6-phosphate isomerase-like protein (cupin superfamily)